MVLGIDRQAELRLPVLTCVSWAQVAEKEFYPLESRDPNTGFSKVWACPYMSSKADFMFVARDGLTAIWKFLKFAGLAAPDFLVPTQEMFVRRLADDLASRNKLIIKSVVSSANLDGKLDQLVKLDGIGIAMLQQTILDQRELNVLSGQSARSLLRSDPFAFMEMDFVMQGSHKKTFFAQVWLCEKSNVVNIDRLVTRLNLRKGAGDWFATCRLCLLRGFSGSLVCASLTLSLVFSRRRPESSSCLPLEATTSTPAGTPCTLKKLMENVWAASTCRVSRKTRRGGL